MTIYKLNAYIYVESDSEPEDIATTLHLGLDSALSGFPVGEVIGAEVQGIREATTQELSDAGLDEA